MTSTPSYLIWPLTSAPRGSSRSMARAVIDLPEPDSPTSPTASPALTLMETSRRTVRCAPSTRRRTVRPSTSSSGSAEGTVAAACPAPAGTAFIGAPPARCSSSAPPARCSSSAPPARRSLPGLRLLEQALAKDVERDYDRDDAATGSERRQRIALRNADLVLRDHDAPVRGRGLYAKAEEGDRGEVDHRVAEQDRRLSDDQRHDVRHDMGQADRGSRPALHLKRRHVRLAPPLQRTPREPGAAQQPGRRAATARCMDRHKRNCGTHVARLPSVTRGSSTA